MAKNDKLNMKMNPIASLVKSAKGDFKVLTGVVFEIENTAKGDTAATDVDQAAVIEIFETEDKANPIGTISATLKIENGKPNFRIAAAAFNGTVKSDETDFRVRLEFSKTSFPTTADVSFTLNLPWKTRKLNLTAPSVENLTLGAQIKIAGVVEVAAFKDKLDIPLLQKEVESADDSTLKHPQIGPGSSGHPLSLFFGGEKLLANGQTIPKANTLFEVHLHESVRRRCESMVSGSFDLAQLKAFIETAFNPVGFTVISFKEIPPGDAAFDRLWTLNTKGVLISKSVANPEGDPTFIIGEGHIVPFFQYLVHAAIRSIGAGELAAAESLDSIQASAKTKRILKPISVPTAFDAEFSKFYKAEADTTARMRLLANLIVHEIGHCLGLMHCQVFDPATSAYSVGATIATMSNIQAGSSMKKFGPVHTALLKKTYP